MSRIIITEEYYLLEGRGSKGCEQEGIRGREREIGEGRGRKREREIGEGRGRKREREREREREIGEGRGRKRERERFKKQK